MPEYVSDHKLHFSGGEECGESKLEACLGLVWKPHWKPGFKITPDPGLLPSLISFTTALDKNMCPANFCKCVLLQVGWGSNRFNYDWISGYRWKCTELFNAKFPYMAVNGYGCCTSLSTFRSWYDDGAVCTLCKIVFRAEWCWLRGCRWGVMQ